MIKKASMENYLMKFLDKYFVEILFIESRLWVKDCLLNQRANEIISESREFQDLFSAGISYDDLTLNSDASWFMPKHTYNLNINELNDELDLIISTLCCLNISQIYDAFETFLLDILAEFIFFQSELIRVLRLKNVNDYSDKKLIRAAIKYQQGSNNNGLIKILRKISTHFKLTENKTQLSW